MSKSSKTRLTITLIIAAILVYVAFDLYYQSGFAYAELQKMDLVPVPEHYTELYFDNASYLPFTIAKGQTASFAFSIHNLEGADTNYPYSVYLQDVKGGKTIIATGTARVASTMTDTVTIAHTFKIEPGADMFVVDLSSIDEKIDFLVNTNE